jgi:uncharacterized protein YrrD
MAARPNEAYVGTPSAYHPVEPFHLGNIMLRNAKLYEGFELRASDGTIGKVKDVYFDDERWHLRYFVVDTGGWMNGRTVLISTGAITAPRYQDRNLATGLTQEQVRNSPAVDTDRPVSRQQELELSQYYAWPYYWTAPVLGTGYGYIGAAAAPTAAALRAEVAPKHRTVGTAPRETSIEADIREATKGDPHLRSAGEVRGYKIEARDGSLGHVEDFLVEDTTWAVRYLLVDTRNWWPGKKVLVPLSHIRKIAWASSRLHVDLGREEIKAGPEFDEDRPLADDYTDRLEAHYRRNRERAK